MNKGNIGDWLAFQGASYFRSAGPLHQYGLSARGIAIDTGLSKTEEFPEFTEFWLERSTEGIVTVYALLDGPSVTGAYRFVNRQGTEEMTQRSEERNVGKEWVSTCRYGWSWSHEKKKDINN